MIFICPFLFYCNLCKHTFRNPHPNKYTLLNLSLQTLYSLIPIYIINIQKSLFFFFRFKIIFCRTLGNESKIVVSTMKKNGFKYTKRNGCGEWNVTWTTQHLRSYEYQGLNRYQRVNQFPRSYEITRKDTLCRNMYVKKI